MANHGPVYGLDAELARKQAAKLDPALVKEATEYVAKKSGVSINGDLGDALNDGTVLCKMANNIQPGSIKKINTGKMPFLKMENINAYLEVCRAWGLKSSDLFQTVDLYEKKNMVAVVQNILQVKRTKN
mmetsp:Transcript_313/g.438  ORF Transcript_313/g.438 Transcript_313/m.438 type:complete len:129 (+) Transcript_313:51-437(+)|eukprot:CAMPEP_0168592486 /NCGR_PEP_ID=MMETSP0420-20121227/7758_1 /TAXON_ID=498008 /ORGANISM="Pessonella sp." /LENGTH=128 /DNA_ID=CAMNT_0008628477 /DNA_START=37 /DNA_END=423 /DNA_ORIENTATION=-